jgi:peptidoglycan/xylan/chitin deacetylase (PgdA/CDA1 family)
MKKVIVTTSWDDGHVLDVKLAELLRRYGIAGTFYIAPENREIAPDKRLDKRRVRSLAEHFEIGAHTMTHSKLSHVGDASAYHEIAASKKVLEDWSGKHVTSFCYPSGDHLPKHEQMVKSAGFSLARTVERFRIDVGTDPFALPTTVHAYRHWSDISLLLSRGYFNWDDLAISLFERAAIAGGVFHLWGHSWEIEKNNDWRRLERVLGHIAHRSEIDYVPNKDLMS